MKMDDIKIKIFSNYKNRKNSWLIEENRLLDNRK